MKLHTLTSCAALASALLFSSPAHADVASDPPSAQIISPDDGETFDGPTATIDVVLDVFEGDEFEGITHIDLRVDGETVATDADAPYGFEGVEVDAGMHVLTAVVLSTNNVEYASTEVNIVVFDGMGTGTGTTEEGEGGTEGGKCAVVDGGRLSGSGVMIVLGLLVLGVARRRREMVQA